MSVVEPFVHLVYVLEQLSIGEQCGKKTGAPHACFPPREEKRPGCGEEGAIAPIFVLVTHHLISPQRQDASKSAADSYKSHRQHCGDV